MNSIEMTFLSKLSECDLNSLKNVLATKDLEQLHRQIAKAQTQPRSVDTLRNELNALKLQNSLLKSQLYGTFFNMASAFHIEKLKSLLRNA